MISIIYVVWSMHRVLFILIIVIHTCGFVFRPFHTTELGSISNPHIVAFVGDKNRDKSIDVDSTFITLVHKNLDGEYGEWFYNDSVEYWNMFGGGDVLAIVDANTTAWGEVIVLIKTSGVSIVQVYNKTVDGETKAVVKYVFQKTYQKNISDFCVGDIYDYDGYDDILVAYENVIEDIATSRRIVMEENVEKIEIGNFDGDAYPECAILTDFPRLWIYDHSMQQPLANSSKLWSDMNPVSLLVGDTNDDGRDEIVVVATNRTQEVSRITKLDNNANIVFQNDSYLYAKMATLMSIDNEANPEYLAMVAGSGTSFLLTYYDISSNVLTKEFQDSLLGTPTCLLAFDVNTDVGYSGDEAFVGVGDNISAYKSSGEKIKTIRFPEGTVECMNGVFMLGIQRGIVCGISDGSLRLLNSSIEIIDTVAISDNAITHISFFQSTNNYTYGIMACDTNNIGSLLHIDNNYEFVADMEFVVSGIVEYVGFLEEEETMIISGDFPFIIGLSLDGMVKWGVRLNGMVTRIDITKSAESGRIVFSDLEGGLYMMNLHGNIVWSKDLKTSIYGLLMDDFDADGQYEVFVGTFDGNAYIIDGEQNTSIMLSGEITDASRVNFDDDQSIEIAVGLLSCEIAVVEYDGSTITASSYSTDGVPMRSTWGDYNGDGDPDAIFVVTNQSAEVTYLYGVDKVYGVAKINHTFDQLSWYGETSSPEGEIILADVTGDCRDDVVFGLVGDVCARVYFVDLSDIDKGVRYVNIAKGVYVAALHAGYADRGSRLDVVCGLSNGSVMLFLDDFLQKQTPYPDKKFTIEGQVKSIMCVDADDDGMGEFAIGGSSGIRLLDYYHYMNMTILKPNITEGEAYVNSVEVSIVWSAFCDMGIEKFSILKNDTPEMSEIPANTTHATISVEEGVWRMSIVCTSRYIDGVQFSRSLEFVLYADVSPPELTIIEAPSTYTNTRDPFFRWNATDNISGILEVHVYLNGTLFSTLPPTQNNYSFHVNTTQTYNVTIEAVDRSGNKAWEARIIHFDFVPPDIVIERPSNEYYTNQLGQELMVEWNASDNIGIDRITVCLPDGTIIDLSPETEIYHVSFGNPGRYEVVVVVWDLAGNNNSDSIIVVIDINPPMLSIISPENGSAYSSSNTQVYIVYQAYDDLSNISYIDVLLDDTLVDRIENMQISAISIDLEAYNKTEEGIHNITMICRDRAGNSIAVVIQVIFDNTPPEVAILSPQAGEIASTEIEIRWSAKDTLSGIRYVEVWIDSKLLGKYYDASGEVKTRLSTGKHKIVVIACDNAGNYGSASVEVTVKEGGLFGLPEPILFGISVAIAVATAITTYVVIKRMKRRRIRSSSTRTV